jgi:hypothetical protein
MSEESAFGKGLRLVNGDITLVNGGTVIENGVKKSVQTFDIVSGRQNLLQSLNLRVLTPFGSDIFNATYGLDVRNAFTSSLNTRTVKEFIRLSLLRTVGSDPRVRDVRTVLFEDEAEYLARHPEASAASLARITRTWHIDVVIETIDAQTETLSLNIGV